MPAAFYVYKKEDTMIDAPHVRVLVVEDEPSVRFSLAGFLEDFNFDVLMAGTAEEALTLIKGEPFQVAIVDVRLPGMDGDAMILKAHEISPSMHFIIYTGSVNYKLSEDLKNIGTRSEYVFPKPQRDLAVFLGAIEDLLKS
jgi:DNA-binding NtrC family response regulator